MPNKKRFRVGDVQRIVREKTGVLLEAEVRIVGEPA